jgi:hypothetical protein
MTMADPALTIDYSGESDWVIDIPGLPPVTITANSSGTLTRPYLVSQVFREKFKTGPVQFAALAGPTEDERLLAVDVTRSLLNALGPQMLTVAKSMSSGKAALGKQRDAYNASRAQVAAVIQQGNGLAPAAQNLLDAAGMFVTADVAQAAVTAAQDAITALDAAFVDWVVANDPDAEDLQEKLSDHLAARKLLEADLAQAQAHLTIAQNSLAAEFGDIQQALGDAITVMEDIEVDDIGHAIAWPP